jgi:ankyrin repeat protein
LYEQKKIDFANPECILGNVPYVKEYLNTTNEPHIFIHRVDHYGDTTLISAAAERTPSVIILLLESGLEVNAINERGRSLLMEAALCGRIDNVELLLQHGAEKDLRDRAGCLAIDLALQNDKNAKERFTQSRGKHQVYREDTFTANKHR